jgi:hypothetical protein
VCAPPDPNVTLTVILILMLACKIHKYDAESSRLPDMSLRFSLLFYSYRTDKKQIDVSLLSLSEYVVIFIV